MSLNTLMFLLFKTSLPYPTRKISLTILKQLIIYTYNKQLFGLGMCGSAKNFFNIKVHASATTFIFKLSINLNTKSNSLNIQYIIRFCMAKLLRTHSTAKDHSTPH